MTDTGLRTDDASLAAIQKLPVVKGLACAFLLVLICVAKIVFAAELSTPTPALEPELVLAIQLFALKQNDSPHTDAGVTRIWAFAHPANRRVTGPLPRFLEMVKSPAYRGLFQHRSHNVELLNRGTRSATFLVTAHTQDNRVFAYRWSLEVVEEGEYTGCWMTTGVSPQITLGTVI